MPPQPSLRHAATARTRDPPPVPPQVKARKRRSMWGFGRQRSGAAQSPCTAALIPFLATLFVASTLTFWLFTHPAGQALLRSLLEPNATRTGAFAPGNVGIGDSDEAASEPTASDALAGEERTRSDRGGGAEGGEGDGRAGEGERVGSGQGRSKAAATPASAFGSDSFLREGNATVPRILTFDLVKTYSHDSRAFTQGLLYVDHEASGGRSSGEGVFYESTGEYGRSTVREVDVATGEVLNSVAQSADVFGEGLALHRDKLYQLAWRVRTGLVYDRETLEPRGSFQHGMADGWGLSVLNESVMVGTDGSSTLFHLHSSSFKAVARVTVKDGGRRIPNLNELEVVGGLVWANVWQSNCIAAIHPDSGRVLAWLDLSELQRQASERSNQLGSPGFDVLNGIAWDSKRNRLFVTGKYWPLMFHINPRMAPLKATPQERLAELKLVRQRCQPVRQFFT
ncbi:hypothetical protein CLOM_g10224 [Closterium sp. NIES-68]|nr:hypothetical protein CLOM_g10224 [Closterium sp. NIES-68]GJP64990.1 hypothetical protein CLOP_g21919 [Closterium sp. NIES-67]